MSRPIVFVPEPIAESALARLAESAEVVVGTTEATGRDWVEEADGLLVRIRPIGADLVTRARRLKVIGKHGVGVDNIPLDAARAKGVAVVNTPGANANAVVELVLGLSLSLARHIPALDATLRAGGPVPKRLTAGIELGGRTVGVIGMGDIGRRVARAFHGAFGSPVVGYDPHADPAVWSSGPWTRVDDLEALLAAADIVTLHLPLTPATRGLIGAAELASMKPSALLISTARGGIVDEAALAEALAAGGIAGAASDVFEVEPPPADHPLLRLPNFVGTPHVGAATSESMGRMGEAVVAGILDVLAGRAPAHRVV